MKMYRKFQMECRIGSVLGLDGMGPYCIAMRNCLHTRFQSMAVFGEISSMHKQIVRH